MNEIFSINGLQVSPLKAFSLDIHAQDIVTLSGTSGSGKSRFLYALADLLPHQGTMQLNQLASEQMAPSAWRQQVMLVPNQQQWWQETAGEHFLEMPDNKLLQAVNLTQTQLTQPISELSTGQKQRFGLLRALTRNPTVLLLDEVTANLDQENTLAVEKLLEEWVHKADRAIIWCSHDAQQIARIANRRLIIEHNELREIS